MTRVDALRELENRLYSVDVQNFFERQPDNVREQFARDLGKLTALVGELENAQLEDIAEKLDELSGDLQAGISDLEVNIGTLNDAVAFLNVLATVLGLLVRIVALVA